MLHGVIYGSFNGFFVFAGKKKRKKRCGGEAGRRDGWQLGEDDGGGASRRAAGRLVVLVVGVRCSDNQSMSLHRFRGRERRRGGLFLHRCNFAPAAAVDREPEAVRLEGGGREPGGEAGGRDGGAIPPYRLRGLGRYVGLVSRNFFLSFGSPRSAVLADSSCVSCCICVDRKRVKRKLYSF